MTTEVVYLGRDNKIDLQLLTDGSPANLANVTRMVLNFGKDSEGSDIEVDSDTSPAAFDWSTGSGMLTLSLGAESLTAGFYHVKLIVYDGTNPNGVVWGEIRMKIV